MIILDGRPGPLSAQVLEAMAEGEALSHRYRQGLADADELEAALDDARNRIARLIGLDNPEGLVFTSGSVEGINAAIKGLAWGADEGREEIAVVPGDPEGFGEAAALCERFGFRVVNITFAEGGALDLAEVNRRISEKTVVVALSSVTLELLVPRDIHRLSERCREVGAALAFDVTIEMICRKPVAAFAAADVVTLDGPMLGGPDGSGLMWVRPRARWAPLLSGGDSQGGRRGGWVSPAAALGLAAALEERERNRTSWNERFVELRNTALETIAECIASARLPWCADPFPSGLTFIVPEVEGEAVVMLAAQEGVILSTGSACSKATGKPSAVLTGIGFTPEEAAGAVHLDFRPEQTVEEVRRGVEVVGNAVKKLRGMK